MNSTDLIKHLEQSHKHLDSLVDPLIYELAEHDKVYQFAIRFCDYY